MLTLAIDVDGFWHNQLRAKALSILVHEASHAHAMHHRSEMAGAGGSERVGPDTIGNRRWSGRVRQAVTNRAFAPEPTLGTGARADSLGCDGGA